MRFYQVDILYNEISGYKPYDSLEFLDVIFPNTPSTSTGSIPFCTILFRNQIIAIIASLRSAGVRLR